MLEQFIGEQRAIFSLLNDAPEWSGIVWDTSGWLNTRMSGNSQLLPFTKLNTKEALPSPYIDFAKAMIVAIFQTKRPSYSAIVAYSIALRRLFFGLMIKVFRIQQTYVASIFMKLFKSLKIADIKISTMQQMS